jgi:hypothetical protein
MFHIQVDLQCVGKLSEILLDDRASAEEYFTNLAKHILQEFFVVVTIDTISICCQPETLEGLKRFSLQMTARGTSLKLLFPPEAVEQMELALEDKIGCVLQELVGEVEIEDVSIENIPPGTTALSYP